MPSLLELLPNSQRARVYRTAIDDDEITAAAKTVGLNVSKLDLGGARGKSGLLDHRAKTLRFPIHFGNNGKPSMIACAIWNDSTARVGSRLRQTLEVLLKSMRKNSPRHRNFDLPGRALASSEKALLDHCSSSSVLGLGTSHDRERMNWAQPETKISLTLPRALGYYPKSFKRRLNSHSRPIV